MCLILFAYKAHPRYPLVIAANRDEFYQRPTKPAYFWDTKEEILAGQDLLEGGTWLGITNSGRWTAVTNFRQPWNNTENFKSRGQLTRDYLELNKASESTAFFQTLSENQDQYGGFNLLAGDTNQLMYFSNRMNPAQQTPAKVEPGVHGLCNHLLNTSWPKVEKGKTGLKSVLEQSMQDQTDIDHDKLLRLLTNHQLAADEELPNTGVGLEWERLLSPLFIQSQEYGTRASTIITQDTDGEICFTEQTYGKNGSLLSKQNFSIQAKNTD